MSTELDKRRTASKGWVTRVTNSISNLLDQPEVNVVKLLELMEELEKRLTSFDTVQSEK